MNLYICLLKMSSFIFNSSHKQKRKRQGAVEFYRSPQFGPEKRWGIDVKSLYLNLSKVLDFIVS